MMKTILLSFLAVVNFGLFANSGDTTTIISHLNQDLHWQGSSYGGKYDEIVNFPTNTDNFQEIKMSFSIGCNNAGVCSHWDYDMNIFVGEYSGINDSTVTSLDTTSTMPLVIDTNWNVFEVIIWHELGRMITPYGTYMDDQSLYDGWDNTWWHTYTYDVTDFKSKLKGQVPVRVHYHGWQDGLYYGENGITNSINDLDESIHALKLFPNPTNNIVSMFIETKKKETININITSILGQKIKSFKMKTNELKLLMLKILQEAFILYNLK